jgi:hypothetical protein
MALVRSSRRSRDPCRAIRIWRRHSSAPEGGLAQPESLMVEGHVLASKAGAGARRKGGILLNQFIPHATAPQHD